MGIDMDCPYLFNGIIVQDVDEAELRIWPIFYFFMIRYFPLRSTD